jgi:hypothetical protein
MPPQYPAAKNIMFAAADVLEATILRAEAAEAERDRAIFKFNDIGNALDEARRQRDVLKEMYRADHDERIRQAEKIKQLESEIAYLRSTDHAADIAFERTVDLALTAQFTEWDTETPFGIALDGQGDEVE